MTDKSHREIYEPWHETEPKTRAEKEVHFIQCIHEIEFFVAEYLYPTGLDLNRANINLMDLDHLLLNAKITLDRLMQAQPSFTREPLPEPRKAVPVSTDDFLI